MPLSREYNANGFKAATLWLIDAIILIGTLWACYRYFSISEKFEDGFFFLGPLDLTLGFMAMFAALEMTRRVLGWTIVIIAALAIFYMLFGEHLPGIFGNAGYSAESVVLALWLSTSGALGTAFGVLTTLVIVYIVFGSIITKTGAGDALIKIAMSLAGGTRGGAAHGAVGASATFGSISGSTVANVVGTGTFTIPLIKKQGFSGRFAGATEAAASTGGTFTPPVMGSAAFLIADLTGTPYLTVAIAATVPALLFYLSLFLAVELEARRTGIQPIPEKDRVKLTARDWLNGLMFLAPILTIIGVMIAGRSASFAGFVSIFVTIGMALLLNPELRRNPMALVDGLIAGGINSVKILVIIASIGMFVGVINSTGLGVKLAQLIGELGREQLFLSLAVTAVAATILSMGMPTTPAYLIVVLTMGPALVQLEAPILAMHMFILYYAALGAVTPPVAGGSYTAAPIADADPILLSFTAFRLTIVAYIFPFVFIYSPEIFLVVDDPAFIDVFSVVTRSILAVILITMGLGMVGKTALDYVIKLAAVGFGILALFDTTAEHWIGVIGGVATLVVLVFRYSKTLRGVAA
ncbi:MAG: TRAP transporter fused permease subunit [Planctomycetota bacterium]